MKDRERGNPPRISPALGRPPIKKEEKIKYSGPGASCDGCRIIIDGGPFTYKNLVMCNCCYSLFYRLYCILTDRPEIEYNWLGQIRTEWVNTNG